jgi:hypothetical protein
MQQGRKDHLSSFFTNLGIISTPKKIVNEEDDIGLDMAEDLAPPITVRAPVDTRRMDELEGSLTDFKDQVSRVDMSNRAVKGELDAIRDDLFQINETIKNLLCIYEAVSKDYNPFVEDSVRKAEPVEDVIITGKEEVLADGGVPEIVEPETSNDILHIDDHVPEKIVPEEISIQLPEVEAVNAQHKAVPGPGSTDDISLIQVFNLVENQLQKLFIQRIKGQKLDPKELQTLDFWFSEFKRLGSE